MRGNEAEGQTSFVGVVNGFPIPMRGNEMRNRVRAGEAEMVSDPHEG